MDKEKVDIIETVLQYNKNLFENLPSFIDVCRDCDEKKVLSTMIDLVDGLMYINDALKFTADIHNIELNVLNSIYINLTNAMENADYYLIGDIIDYDLLPNIRKIDSKLKEIDLHL